MADYKVTWRIVLSGTSVVRGAASEEAARDAVTPQTDEEKALAAETAESFETEITSVSPYEGT